MPSESRTLAVSPQTCVSRFLAPQGGSFCGNGGILTSFPRHCQFADSWVARGYAEINIAGASTLCYNLHLESRFNVCIAQPSPSLPNVSQTVVRRPYDTARSSSLPAHTVAAISMAWVSASWGRTVASGRAFQISSVVGG